MDYVMRRRSTVGGALEMFSLPLPFLHIQRPRRYSFVDTKWTEGQVGLGNFNSKQYHTSSHRPIGLMFTCAMTGMI